MPVPAHVEASSAANVVKHHRAVSHRRRFFTGVIDALNFFVERQKFLLVSRRRAQK